MKTLLEMRYLNFFIYLFDLFLFYYQEFTIRKILMILNLHFEVLFLIFLIEIMININTMSMMLFFLYNIIIIEI